jgi:hypothetical protein
MHKHGVASDEVWQVKGGKNYAVKHAALERIAYQNSITFGLPTIIEANSKEKVCAMLVTGHMGDFSEWSIGEAAPSNITANYPWAMAEKRAKDRVILKLLNIHGVLYSEDEADDFKRQEKGELIPVETEIFKGNGKPKAAHAIKKDEPERWGEIVAEFTAAQTLDDLRFIGEQIAKEVEAWPPIWRGWLEDEYKERQTELKQQQIRGAA